MSTPLPRAPRPFVLWIQTAERLEPPAVIVTPGTPDELKRWRERNRWADAVPAVVFGTPDELPAGRRFGVFAGEARQVPSVVENAPAAWADARHPVGDAVTFREALEVYGAAVEAIALALPPGPVWVVGGHADGGVAAVEVARALGRCVALCSGPPGVLAAAWGNRRGVDISSRERSGDGLR